MRLWSLHPSYLDARGLVALWREGLLAQRVLRGGTAGYRHHPQLWRFQGHANPMAAISTYLEAVLHEADRREYCFDASKIGSPPTAECMPVTAGQMRFEWEHLRAKLRARAPKVADMHAAVVIPRAHPLFDVVPGPVEAWERAA